ncbi:MAG: hypothetical protein SGJ19_26460 [Planctomycetia bacterium]|nr:hypothetical protein [Planctomycetia bacterium]
MGAEPWQYFVPFEQDFQRALDKLKEREFVAGRFRYSEEGPTSIEEAREIADADGTGSILDIDRVDADADFGVVVPLSDAQVQEFFGTDRPTRAVVQASDDLYEDIERGQGVCCTVYVNGQPSEICFCGYSYD